MRKLLPLLDAIGLKMQFTVKDTTDNDTTNITNETADQVAMADVLKN